MTHPSRGSRPRPSRLLAGLAAGALAIGLSFTGTPAAHAATTYFCADDTVPYAPVSEVESFSAGTAVTGLTVTSGTTPSGFTGTYTGYIADGLGKGKDMLLFTLSSPVIDGTAGLKAAGIWAGMSGSPVYTTDGRLIGAVSYSLNGDNLPVAGVTPAEYMKTIGTTALGTASTKIRVSAANLRTATAATTSALTGSTFAPAKTVQVAGPAGTQQNAFTNRTLARTPRTAKAAASLRSGTFLPAAAVNDDLTAPLVAGGTIAASYTSGDLIASAVGTVTAVCGDTVWAFGHPMNFAGKTNLFMSNASTALIVPDATGTYGSYKQVSAFGEPVGTITQDRYFGIRGALGTTTATPVTVNVTNAAGTPVDTYSMDVADPEVLASAVGALVGQAAYEQLDQYGSGTAKISWTIEFTRESGEQQSLTNSMYVEDAYYFPDAAATYPAEDVWTIGDSGLEDVTITGVTVTLQLLSADALSYRASGVQVQGTSGSWSTLSGAKLKAATTYQLRPVYSVVTNDTPKGKVYGDPFTAKLSKKAKTSGTFTLQATSDADEFCDEDECEDWSEDSDSEETFDDLLADLDALPVRDEVSGALRYKLKSGSSVAWFDLVAPGYVTGSKKVAFTIK
ncbi:MAG: hypothetical protein QM779_09810 [Propionicimonas sp.]|uniref:hypothetical protein n=1 Tax=Propionicimonas sp. TaxID=1955623 RepID=UPI003D0D05E2